MTSNSPLPTVNERVDAPPAVTSADRGAADDEEISLLDLLIVLAERKRTVLRVTGVFAVLAVILSMILPVRYTATVTLLPPQESSSMGAAMASLGNLGGVAALAGGSLGLKNPNDRYVAMLQSRTVEDAMVQRYGLMQEYHAHYLSDARKVFQGHTTVDGTGKDGLIHITVEDHNAQKAAELANGYVEEYRDLSQHLAITEASQRRLFFQRELEQAKNNLANAEVALEQTEQKTGVIQPDSQARALIESAATLRAQITAREVQIEGMQTYATGQNSELIQAQQELAGLRAQLAKLGGSEDNSGSEVLIPKGLVPQAGMEYVRRLRDVKYYETIFDILARQFELAKLDEAKEGAVIQVVDPAIPPDRKSFPKRSLIVLGATVAGFFIGAFLALFQAALQRLKADPEGTQKLSILRRAFSAKRL
ncbi:Wzz/FepE/Etk N-terminal domain-containing protein [Granulicella sp. L46]|uniref:GumC family protein n=1 Tax=Granulicella sp. L46 TaxID=1641865 RepID=UPI00131BDD86|nr:Wzz/FepE/Etk N-terminal domain-containing protein [Granulicella sp. L46]